eukprot:500292-Rhodomonas_salina.1
MMMCYNGIGGKIVHNTKNKKATPQNFEHHDAPQFSLLGFICEVSQGSSVSLPSGVSEENIALVPIASLQHRNLLQHLVAAARSNVQAQNHMLGSIVSLQACKWTRLWSKA